MRCIGVNESQPHDELPQASAHENTTVPTIVAMTVATTNVVGMKRTAKRRPNTPACIENSFRSTIGPTVRKARRAVSENWPNEAATNASDSEHNESNTASKAMAI